MISCASILYSALAIYGGDWRANIEVIEKLRDTLGVGESIKIESIPRESTYAYKQLINTIPGIVVISMQYGTTGSVYVRRFK